jgi:phosphate transport system permease protein
MAVPAVSPKPMGFEGNRSQTHQIGLERLMAVLLALAGSVPIGVIGVILAVFVHQSWLFFHEVPLGRFLTDTRWSPLFSTQQFGIGVLLTATLMISAIALVVAIPVGLFSAIYLSEYASPLLRQSIKPLLETLSGIPTIVYGYFALLFVSPQLRHLIPELSVFNGLSAGLVTGLLITPIIASLSEDALRAVPLSQRQAAYACGLTRQEVIIWLLLPAAFPGILASCTLAASRALGETMIAAVAAGQNPRMTLNPFVPVESMTAFIVQVSLGNVATDSLVFRTIFAVGMTLFLLTLALNWLGNGLIHRYRHLVERQEQPQAALPIAPTDLPDFPSTPASLGNFTPHWQWRQWTDRVFSLLGLGASLVGPICLGILVLVTFRSGLSELNWHFITNFTSRNPEDAGILAGLVGTLWLLGLTALLAVPLGLGAAIYLEEYGQESFWSRWVEINIANATAIPGILYGLLGMAVFARGLGWLTGGRSVISGALIMTVLVLPLLITASRTALRSVPTSLKKSGYAIGMGRWQVTWHITLPAALPNLITGLVLALSRVLGETSPLIALGTVEFVTFVPTPTPEGLRVPFMTLTTQIFFWLSRPQDAFQAKAAAAIILLGLIVLAMNLLAGVLRDRLRTLS